MHKITYDQINETLYTEVLPNGLTVYLLPKAGYHKTYGLFSTNYGSLDNRFVPLGESEPVTVPDGIAHFLEHKLFEKEAGDVFQVFGKQGASANAFTSFTKTSYLFSATDQIRLNLETLLDFVQEPYFTKESVEKEKGIIGQEIGMYQDDPYFLQFSGLLAQMYPDHPLAVDILGTVETIDKITPEDLYLCYRTFYQPSNMKLLVVGNIDPEETMDWIKANQTGKEFPEATPIRREFPEESLANLQRTGSRKLPLSRSKGALGIKGLIYPKTRGNCSVFVTALICFWHCFLAILLAIIYGFMMKESSMIPLALSMIWTENLALLLSLGIVMHQKS